MRCETTVLAPSKNLGTWFGRINLPSPSITVILLGGILAWFSLPSFGATFFVATTGNDNWSGKMPNPRGQNGPFATLKRARDAVRGVIQSGLTEPVKVAVRGGTYYPNETLVLDSQDNGTQEFRITWSAYENEKPVISGGKPITGWTTYQGDVQWATVTPGWKFLQLFLNGERQIRSRTPNFDPGDPLYGGWAFIEGRGDQYGEKESDFMYPVGLFQSLLAKPHLADVFLNAGFGSDITPITAIDHANRFIHTNYLATESYTSNTRFRIENALEELDQPGEWFLDWEIGKVYFWPPNNSVGAEVAAPNLLSLITLSGAQHVTISGFSFTNTKARAGIGQAAVILESTKYCRVMRNHFSAVGGNAVNLVGDGPSNPCELNLVQYNEISLAGDEAIHLRDTAQFNHILDNHIHNCGALNHYSAGITFGTQSPVTETRHSNGNLIAHNEVHDLPRDGITVGTNAYGRNVVRYNIVSRTGRESKDAGALRSWMFGSADAFNTASPDIPDMVGHVFEYNFVSDVLGVNTVNGQFTVPYDGLGIYLDDLTANTSVRGNIIARAALSGFHTNYGRNNVLENNIFVDCKDQITFSKPPHIGGPILDKYMTGNRVVRNILYTTDRQSSAGRFPYVWNFMSCPPECTQIVAESDYHLFYRSDGDYSGLSSWQALGYDSQSASGDPLFTGSANSTADRDLPEQFGYQLQPRSPARGLSFAAIDVALMGRRPDAGPYQGFVNLTIQVDSPGQGDTVLPAPGTYQIAKGDIALLSTTANALTDRPTAMTFDHWEGNVADSTLPITSVLMDEDKTVTCVFIGDKFEQRIDAPVEAEEAAKALYLEARREENRGNSNTALNLYEKSLAVSLHASTNTKARNRIAKLLYSTARTSERNGNIVQATRIYHRILKLVPDTTISRSAEKRLAELP